MPTTWVFAESAEGKPLSITLELLTKARQLGGTVEAFYAGGDADAIASQLGAYGATKVYAIDPGDLLFGAPVAAAMAAQIEAGPKPDLIMFGQTYDGRDVMGRLSARIDRPVLPPSLGVAAEGGEAVAPTALFRGRTAVRTAVTP